MKDLLNRYNNQKVFLNIYYYILKIIQNLDKIFMNLECANKIILIIKLRYIKELLWIIEFICGLKKRYLEIFKIIKIIN